MNGKMSKVWKQKNEKFTFSIVVNPTYFEVNRYANVESAKKGDVKEKRKKSLRSICKKETSGLYYNGCVLYYDNLFVAL